jgi:hypothetical protein
MTVVDVPDVYVALQALMWVVRVIVCALHACEKKDNAEAIERKRRGIILCLPLEAGQRDREVYQSECGTTTR